MEVKFLGFIVGKAKIRINPSHIETIIDWPELKTYYNI